MDTAVQKEHPGKAWPLAVVSGLVFLLPILIIPVPGAPFAFSKTALAMLAVLILMLLYAVRTVREGILEIPSSPLMGSLIILPLAYLSSAMFSEHPALSFWGYQLDVDTFGFVAIASAAALLVALSIPAAKAFSPLVALVFSSWVVLLFQTIQIFFGAPFPIFPAGSMTANLVGSWSEFGIFAGLIVSLALFALGSLSLPFVRRTVIVIMLVLGLAFLVLVNVWIVWAIVALVAFGVLVSVLLSSYVMKQGAVGGLSAPISATVLAMAVFFMTFGGGAASPIQAAAGVQAFEVRPSVQGTLAVIGGVYAESPLVGSGPNTFAALWLLYRPSGILSTPFWDTPFTGGFGAVPTAFSTGGLLVGAAWALVLAALFYTIARMFFAPPRDTTRRAVISSLAAVGALYLALIHLAYSPGPAVSLLFFIMLGLLVASLKGTSLVPLWTIRLSSAPRIGFVSIMLVITLSVAALASSYGVARAYLGSLAYGQAVAAANAGDLGAAEALIGRAIEFAERDQYHRARVAIGVARLSEIIASNESDAAAQAAFRDALVQAVDSARAAVAWDPARYENWIARADVYASVVPLRIDGAYETALEALERARSLSPQSPEVDYRIAVVMAANGDLAAARDAALAALLKKADYTQAIMLLAQIELEDGHLDKAIDSVASAVYFEPENPTLLYQLGVLVLSDGNYADAARAFEAALASDPSFANVKFFLAQSYAFLGRFPEAARLMRDLALDNPGNTEVLGYAESLAEGRNPFTASTAPPGNDALE